MDYIEQQTIKAQKKAETVKAICCRLHDEGMSIEEAMDCLKETVIAIQQARVPKVDVKIGDAIENFSLTYHASRD